MKTLSIVSRKGGAGKSSFVIHLSVIASKENRRVLIIDVDEQGSASAWWKRRSSEQPALIQCSPLKVAEVLVSAREHKFDWVLIDTPPNNETFISHVVKHADLLVIPCRPNPLDLVALATTIEITGQASSLAVLNQAPPQRHLQDVSRTIRARIALMQLGATVAPISITNRVSVSESINSGLGITEAEPDGKAATEFQTLWKFIKQSFMDKAAITHDRQPMTGPRDTYVTNVESEIKNTRVPPPNLPFSDSG